MILIGKQGKKTKYTARLFLPDAVNVRLRLFKTGDTEPFERLPMAMRPGAPGIFECVFDPVDFAEYDFERDGEVFADPYSLILSGNFFFGEKPPAYRSLAGAADIYGAEPYPDSVCRHPEYSDLIIYKLHVRGFTAHESSGVRDKGTFKGVKQKLGYIAGLGFNAILLMPCYEFNEHMKPEYNRKNTINFWGYGAEGFYFAPKASYAAEPGRCREEFADMVRSAHDKGIEVLMEMDFAPGTPDIMMLEALRYWHLVYHVDGFRLMNADILDRLMASDPMLSGCRILAGSWSSECKKLRSGLAECNDGFMNLARRFLKSDEGTVQDFAYALRNSGDAAARINYLADHDGFTVRDMYTYDARHNEANGEDNRDGREINYSWNCGAEGTTGNRQIIKLREKMIRNAFTVLMTAQGTPMVMAGDEFGYSHAGNNNPYCQDNADGYVIWDKSVRAKELKKFVEGLIGLRKAHRCFSNSEGLKGTDYVYKGYPDISFHGTKAWYPDYSYCSRTLGMLLNGEYALRDKRFPDDSFFVAYNMHWEEHEFDLPIDAGEGFELILCTDSAVSYSNGKTCAVPARSIAVFRLKRTEEKPENGTGRRNTKKSEKASLCSTKPEVMRK